MFRNRYAMMCIAAAMILTVSVAGCGKKTEDNTKVAQPRQIGIVDMEKAAKAHPKYAQYTKLQEDYNTLMQQLQAEQNANQAQASQGQLSAMPDTALTGLNEALSQEFSAKMQAKQDELQNHLNGVLEKAKADASAQMEAYTQEVDQVYQPQILSLQLKIKTVQMDKDALALQQQQLEKLQNERADKLSAKENEMMSQIDAVMSPQKAQAEADLNAYAKQLHAELDQKGAAKQAEITARVEPTPAIPDTSTASLSDKQQQLGMRQKEIEVLHDTIEKDIRDKAAKIATERNLEAVLVQVTVNVSGVDITNDIIAAFNK